MEILPYILTVFSCLNAVAADNPICNVTESRGLVLYHIVGTSDPANATCHFSWSNKTGNVLANQEDHDRDLVKESSARRLVTLQCLNQVLFEFSCEPEWGRKSGDCKATCAEKIVVPVEITPSPEHITVGANVAAAVFVPVVFLLLAVVGWLQKSRLAERWTLLRNKMWGGDAATVTEHQDVPLNKPPV